MICCCQEIESDFVECRKVDKQKMTSDDLHLLLTIARCVVVAAVVVVVAAL